MAPRFTLPRYTGRALDAISFPIGGIGTGTVGLGGRGQLRDWEILDGPAKGQDNPHSFFALWARTPGGPTFCKVLESRLRPPYAGRTGGSDAMGVPRQALPGLPRFSSAVFRGEYPFAWVELRDDTCPFAVTLEAFNPMIPLDDRDSGIPVAIFRWTLRNESSSRVEASVAAVVGNMVWRTPQENLVREQVQEARADDGLSGVWMSNAAFAPGDHRFATMCLATPHREVDVQAAMYQGAWWDRWHVFWDEFSASGRVAVTQGRTGRGEDACVVLRTTLDPGHEVTLPVFLTWHVSNRRRSRAWFVRDDDVVLRNWCATQWTDAWDVARDVHARYDDLDARTRRYHATLFESTLPKPVLDAVSSQSSTIRTSTCFRLADGVLHAFEGCSDDAGCCPLNCTHVWNYEQTLAHLFPALERTMRETDFEVNTRPTGNMAFRTVLPVRQEECAPECECPPPGSDERLRNVDAHGLWTNAPCADGQMGCVLKTYREWRLSGDTNWLRRLWPRVRAALEYAWTGEPGRDPWDADRDGVMEGEQHNTYDIELYGPNTMMGTLYLGALRAAELMARAVGDDAAADDYRVIFESGRARTDAELWNGEFYEQRIVPPVEIPERLRSPDGLPKYQVGSGCLSDQLLGQWFAHVVGLGHLLDAEHVRTAMKSVYRHNFRATVGDVSNVQRVYALGDEAGLVLCTWPRGGRPALPFVYCDEVWTGIEYQVAAGLIYEGLVVEGLDVVRAVRARHAGHNRNPWDEVECGHHYARALSSWSVLLALSGYSYSAPDRHLAFAPRVTPQRFRCFFSTASAWGLYSQRIDGEGMRASLDVRRGVVELRSFGLEWPREGTPATARASVGRRGLSSRLAQDRASCTIRFDETATLREGQTLRLSLDGRA